MKIGVSGNKIANSALTKCYYKVPVSLMKTGKIVIAVRVWNSDHGGGRKGNEGAGPLKADPDQM